MCNKYIGVVLRERMNNNYEKAIYYANIIIMEKIFRFYNNRPIYKLHLACTLYGDVGVYTVW